VHPNKKIIVSAVLIALLICFIVFGILFLIREKKNHNHLTLYGNVDVRQIDIGFRVSGQVEKLYFEEGDFVHEGELMATLDHTPYDDQVRQAAANLEAIKVQFKNAEILLKRRKELIQIGGVSQEDLDNSQANRDQLQSDLFAAEAALGVARDNLKYTKAYCPTDGTILTRIREPGTVVNPSDPVYTHSVASPVWIRAYVDEPHLGDVFFNMSAKIMTDTKKAPVYTGKVGFISPMAEFTPKTVETADLRTDLVYRLRIYVDNPDQFLKQGMPVTVKLNLPKNRNEYSGE
jgi:HlyD family secretion protein